MYDSGFNVFHISLPLDINRADFKSEISTQKELSFEVKFAGIDTVLVQDDHDIVHCGIQGTWELVILNIMQTIFLLYAQVSSLREKLNQNMSQSKQGTFDSYVYESIIL